MSIGIQLALTFTVLVMMFMTMLLISEDTFAEKPGLRVRALRLMAEVSFVGAVVGIITHIWL